MPCWNKKGWGNTNIYVKNFRKDWTEAKLSGLFATYGTITSLKIVTDEYGISKGFGFINFQRPEMAQRAIDHLHGYELENGRQLYVAPFQGKFERTVEPRQVQADSVSEQTNHPSIHVSNLDKSVDEDKLRNIFSPFGYITRINTGVAPGTALIYFGSDDDANRAVLHMDGHRVASKTIRVKLGNGNSPVTSPDMPSLMDIRPVTAPPPPMLAERYFTLVMTGPVKYQPYPYNSVLVDDDDDDF